MNLDIKLNKKTCFYYWVQAVSGWDVHSTEPKSYKYYQDKLDGLSASQKNSIKKIKNILQSSKDPRLVLAELYSGDIKNDESIELSALAKALENEFENIWQVDHKYLEKWLGALKKSDLTLFHDSLEKVVFFLDSEINLDDIYKLYLLQTPPSMWATGHALSKTDFILLHPPGEDRKYDIDSVLCTVLHEYVHMIEFQSTVTEQLFKNSYEKYISTQGIPPPSGYTWKMVYRETLVYSFASKTIGGYFRPELYKKPRPQISDMQKGFWNKVKNKNHSTEDVINWVALNLLPDIKSYISENKKIDSKIVDKISKIYLEFF